MKNKVDIYWAIVSDKERQTLMNLLWEPPVPLVKILPKGRQGSPKDNYRACSAGINFWKNTFAIINPQDAGIRLTGDYDNPEVEATGRYWTKQPSALDSRYRIDYDYSWIFFSEESIIMQQLPPFMHKTTAQDGAGLSSGSYDISKWFRPVNCAYNLWDGSNELFLRSGDPLAYFQFLTDKDINLVQFEMNDKLTSIYQQVVFFKSLLHFEPIEKLYSRFIKSNRHRAILKEIKNNII